MYNNNNVSSGPASGILKPKYKAISSMVDHLNITGGFDVYIDLNTYVKSLSTYSRYLQSLPFSKDAIQDLVHSILMIVKHWKDYCRKYEDSKIILFVNDFEMVNLPEQEIIKSYLYPYINKFKENRYQQFVYYFTEAFKIVETVLKYVPNVYLIRCNRFDSLVIPNILYDYSKDRYRLIISGSSMMTAYLNMKNTCVIYSIYRHTGMTQMSDPRMIVSSVSKIDEDIMNTFISNKVFYNILNSIIGDFDRALIGLSQSQLGLSGFAVNLLRSIEKKKIPNDPLTLDVVLPVIEEKYHEYLQKAYPLVDIDSHTKLIPQSMIEKVKSNMIDIYDIDGLKALTVKDLNLMELL